MSFPPPQPKKPYCRKHSIEYVGYICPECAQEMRKEAEGKNPTKPINSNNHESREIESKFPIFRCKECGLKTLVKIREKWYECSNKSCKACGSSPESVIRLEILYTREEAAEKEQDRKTQTDKSSSQEEDVTESSTIQPKHTELSTEHPETSAEEAAEIPPQTVRDSQHVSNEESIKLPAENANRIYSQAKESGPDTTTQASSSSKSTERNETLQSDHLDIGTKKPGKSGGGKLPIWIIVLLLVFAVSMFGVGLSIFIKTFIPFWILFVFSIIFSIERWFIYDTRKHKWLGRLYRLILNLGILLLFGLIIWSGIKLFSHQFVQGALVGSILFVFEFAFFIWMWRIVAKNSWRWPTMKLTIFTLICLFLIFSFAGVQPMASYKDTALSKIQSAFTNKNNNQPVTTHSNDVTIIPLNTITPTNVTVASSQTIATVQSVKKGINSQTGVYKNYYLGLVNDPEGIISGDGCYDDIGDFIILINNKNAADVAYAQLVNFLQNDKTDQYPYNYNNRLVSSYYGTAESHVDLKNIQNIIDGNIKPSNPDVCCDFAERLHNEAEMAGIRCAYVSLDMTGYSDPLNLGISSNAGHACNAFQTTDRGLIYIDATGMSPNLPHPSRPISTVKITVGQQYVPISLFPEAGWQNASESMGIITNIFMTWDGTWNNK